jgi:hypothetical protein
MRMKTSWTTSGKISLRETSRAPRSGTITAYPRGWS